MNGPSAADATTLKTRIDLLHVAQMENAIIVTKSVTLHEIAEVDAGRGKDPVLMIVIVTEKIIIGGTVPDQTARVEENSEDLLQQKRNMVAIIEETMRIVNRNEDLVQIVMIDAEETMVDVDMMMIEDVHLLEEE